MPIGYYYKGQEVSRLQYAILFERAKYDSSISQDLETRDVPTIQQPVGTTTKLIQYTKDGQLYYAEIPKEAQDVRVAEGDKVVFTLPSDQTTIQTVEKYPVYSQGKPVTVAGKEAYLSAGISAKLKKEIEEGKIQYTTEGIQKGEKVLQEEARVAAREKIKDIKAKAVEIALDPFGYVSRRIGEKVVPYATGEKISAKISKEGIDVTGVKWELPKYMEKLATGQLATVTHISTMALPTREQTYGFTEKLVGKEISQKIFKVLPDMNLFGRDPKTGKEISFLQAEKKYLKNITIGERASYTVGTILGYQAVFRPIGFTEIYSMTPKFVGKGVYDAKTKTLIEKGIITKTDYLHIDKPIAAVERIVTKTGKYTFKDTSVYVQLRDPFISKLFHKPSWKSMEILVSKTRVTPEYQKIITDVSKLILKPDVGGVTVKHPKLLMKAFRSESFTQTLFKGVESGGKLVNIPVSTTTNIPVKISSYQYAKMLEKAGEIKIFWKPDLKTFSSGEPAWGITLQKSLPVKIFGHKVPFLRKIIQTKPVYIYLDSALKGTEKLSHIVAHELTHVTQFPYFLDTKFGTTLAEIKPEIIGNLFPSVNINLPVPKITISTGQFVVGKSEAIPNLFKVLGSARGETIGSGMLFQSDIFVKGATAGGKALSGAGGVSSKLINVLQQSYVYPTIPIIPQTQTQVIPFFTGLGSVKAMTSLIQPTPIPLVIDTDVFVPPVSVIKPTELKYGSISLQKADISSITGVGVGSLTGLGVKDVQSVNIHNVPTVPVLTTKTITGLDIMEVPLTVIPLKEQEIQVSMVTGFIPPPPPIPSNFVKAMVPPLPFVGFGLPSQLPSMDFEEISFKKLNLPSLAFAGIPQINKKRKKKRKK